MAFSRIAAFAISGLSACVLSTAAQAAGHNNIVKGGVAQFIMNDDSTELSGPSTPPGVTVGIEDATAVTFTYTRLIGEQFGVEVVAGIPFEVDVTASGSMEGLGKVATVKAAPVNFIGEYYFTPRNAKWRPYVGLSYHYTTFFDGEATPALNGALSGETDVEASNSSGPGAYVGLNYAVNDNWLVSGLIGYNSADTDVTLTTDTMVDMGSGPVSIGDIERGLSADINPVSVSAMIGFRF